MNYAPLQCRKRSMSFSGPTTELDRMGCNFKKVTLNFFKFLHFRFRNAPEQSMSCPFQEFN